LPLLTGHNHQHLEQVQISRDFGGGIEMIFPNFALPKTIDREEILNLIADAATELEAIPPLAKEGSLREEMQAILRGIGNTTDPKSAFSANELTAIQRKLSGALPEVTAPTSSLGSKPNNFIANRVTC
jgi:hypothetical protein